MASLPTSKDHIPYYVAKKHGCINIDSINFNCYFFVKGTVITDNEWSFPFYSYVYGQQIDTLDRGIFEEMYAIEGVDYEIIGKLSSKEFTNLKTCILNSASVKRKIKELLR